MKLHPKIEQEQTIELQIAILEKATETKLDKINFKTRYNVIKIKAKKKNQFMEDSGQIIMRAIPYIIGNPKDGVALYFYTTNEWFHTSYIQKCTKYKKFIRIETLNSVYKLYPWK